tara:strand:+ start:31 stop:237 length:207 start_codon:yes stop_codon:yes gene_type:complete
MVYTVVYSCQSGNGSYTFVSSHDKNVAWYDFINNHAEEGQTPIAICPGNIVIYFEDCISPEEIYNEAS